MIERTMKNHIVHITENNLTALEAIIKTVHSGKRLFIITDDNVSLLHKDSLDRVLDGFKRHYVTVTPGESSKSFTVYQETLKRLLERGIRRDDFILAFGGGVVGDLTGFIAATLFRGMPYGQIPTTLLAQVDSSVGSKVAIDMEEGKNLIGAFYDPAFVFIDTEFLKTLPKRELNNGLAEIIKAGLIKDPALYERLLEGASPDNAMIVRAIDVKRDLVIKDPYDNHERMFLNFGHTFGHAIEKAHHYETYKHGEAISQGMMLAIKTGIRLGITDPSVEAPLEDLFLKHDLITLPLPEPSDYIPHLKADKKNVEDGIRFILIEAPGKTRIVTLKEEDLL